MSKLRPKAVAQVAISGPTGSQPAQHANEPAANDIPKRRTLAQQQRRHLLEFSRGRRRTGVHRFRTAQPARKPLPPAFRKKAGQDLNYREIEWTGYITAMNKKEIQVLFSGTPGELDKIATLSPAELKNFNKSRTKVGSLVRCRFLYSDETNTGIIKPGSLEYSQIRFHSADQLAPANA
jgi:hypothetical protein